MAKEASDNEEHVPSWAFDYEYKDGKDKKLIILTMTDEAKKDKPQWIKKIDKSECGGKSVSLQYDEYYELFEDETIKMRVEFDGAYKEDILVWFEEPGEKNDILKAQFRLTQKK